MSSPQRKKVRRTKRSPKKQPVPEKKQSGTVVALKLIAIILCIVSVPFLIFNPNISLGPLDVMRKGIFAWEITLKGKKLIPDDFSQAIQLNDKNLVKLYAHTDFDLNQQDSSGISPICYAASLDKYEILNILLKKEVNLRKKNISDGYTPVFCAVRSNNPQIIDEFVKRKIDINTRSEGEDGISPLHYAVMLSKEASVAHLLKIGANVNLHDVSGRTPLHYAVLQNNVTILHMLLNANADFNLKDDSGSTPFDIALQSGNVEYVDILRNRGYVETAAPIDIENFSSIDALQELQKFKNTSDN